jgi:hypothetical protein
MSLETQEPELPYSPSNTGRGTRVGYLGFAGVSFNDLWPLFAGLALSLLLGLRFFVAGDSGGRGWAPNTVLALAPFGAGFAYLRFLVVGRPPHFKSDLAETLLGLRVDFTEPPFRLLPVLPRLRIDTSAAGGPERAADLRHPMGPRRAGRS